MQRSGVRSSSSPPLTSGQSCSGLFLAPGRSSAGGAAGEMRMRAPRFWAGFRPPNPPSPSLISVCAEVAIRTTPRIHAGFGAVVCVALRLPIEQNKNMLASYRPKKRRATSLCRLRIVWDHSFLPRGPAVRCRHASSNRHRL